MRFLTLVFVAALFAGPAYAQAAPRPPSLADALACERNADPAACLLRAGATGWTGFGANGSDVMRAIVILGLDRGRAAIAFGRDDRGVIQSGLALGETLRLDQSGAAPEAALAPIAALRALRESGPRSGEQAGYVLLAYSGGYWDEMLIDPSPPLVRLALTRIEEIARADTRYDVAYQRHAAIPILAEAYASNGLAAEGRALVQRWGAETDAFAFWVEINDFAAAERAVRAEDRPHPYMLIEIARGAAETGDNARAIRLAGEVFSLVRTGRMRTALVLDSDKVFLIEVTQILIAAGRADIARGYARSLTRRARPSAHDFGDHLDAAADMLALAGDEAGACALGRRLAASVHARLSPAVSAEDRDEVAAQRGGAAARRLFLCGLTEEAYALGEYGPRDRFLIAHGLNADMAELATLAAALDPPTGTAPIVHAINVDVEHGRADRAVQLAELLWAQSPGGPVQAVQLAASAMRMGLPELMDRFRPRLFEALHLKLAREGRAESASLDEYDREAVFAAALTLLEHDVHRGVRQAQQPLPD